MKEAKLIVESTVHLEDLKANPYITIRRPSSNGHSEVIFVRLHEADELMTVLSKHIARCKAEAEAFNRL